MKSIRRPHSAVVRLGFGMAILFAFLPNFASSQTLKWEVVNPFRFIHDPESIEQLKKAYASLEIKTAEALERKLQDISEAETDRLRSAERAGCIANGGSDAECTARSKKFPYLGWFEKVARNGHAKTCWNSVNVKFRDDAVCRDYINPTKHRVRVWLEGLTSPPSEIKWLVDGEQGQFEDCNFAGKANCKEFNADYIFTKPAGTIVSVVTRDGGVIAKSAPIVVKDKLVAGLGDSYASGEGNPDIPAQFSDRQSDVDFAYFWKWRRTPRKDKLEPSGRGEVAWLDRRCHRSMYSYQFKAALQLALSGKPDETVTFVSYACSGGVTDDIIDRHQAAKEKMRVKGVSNTLRPQLKELRDVLKGRSIDYLLLSTGGNDLSFAEYVTNIILSGRTRVIGRLFGLAKKPSEKETLEGIPELRENYAKLQKTLFSEETGVAIKDCSKDKPCRRIILTAYPDYFNNELEKPCAIDRDEFTLPFNRDSKRADRAADIKRLFATELFAFQTRTDIDATGGYDEPTRWTLADSHRKRYRTQGFCAQAAPANAGDPIAINENFMMLRRKNGDWYAYDWRRKEIIRKYYDPRDYKAYGLRQRWIRLPVDSKMTADEQKRFLNWFSYDLFFLDDRSSIIHPTAHALAVHADANLEKIRQLERAP